MFYLICALIAVPLFAIYVFRSLYFVAEDEQLFVEGLTDKTVINGPGIKLLKPLFKKAKKKRVTTLGELQYCIVKNNLTGEMRVEEGPKLLFLGAYDKAETPQTALSLTAREFVRFLDQTTGQVRVVIGEQGRVVPGAHETFVDQSGKRNAIDLRVFEYVKIQDRKTGQMRVERGEQLVFLQGFEEVVDGGKMAAIEVDESKAVLVRNKRTGQQSLQCTKQLFVPGADEEIIEVRPRIKLAKYEACIVRNKDGKDTFYFGKNSEQSSFFLPPHCTLLELVWSRGRRRERRDLRIKKIDLRPMYMSFEFNCRTSDNVELILEGSFFWEVIDLEAMVLATGDTSGDVCNHARSKFIELVSKVSLQQFMADFNSIAQKVHEKDSTFYEQRGVCIHSLEISGYKCADNSTARILQQIIQETTNRMNRLQKQESENEVQLQEIRGDVDEETARQELIKIQAHNSTQKAIMHGRAEAETVRGFLEGLKDVVPNMQERVDMWKVLRKKDALSAVAGGNSRLFFTPDSANLSIESHDHSHK